MISLPPIVLLIPYLIFALGFAFFAFANILSLAKYGARNAVGMLTTFIFVSGTAIIVFLTWQSLITVDWFTPVALAAVPAPSF